MTQHQSAILRHLFFGSERGTPSFEFLLYLPIALLFLFVATDAGLNFLERAALSDALRSGLNSEALCVRRIETARAAESLSPLPAASHAIEVASCIASEISNTVIHQSRFGTPLTAGDFRLTISLVTLNIDRGNGTLTGVSVDALPLSDSLAGTLNLADRVPSFPLRQQEDFISDELRDDWGRAPSRFALPASESSRYLETTIGIYAELAAVSRGTNSMVLRSVIGRTFAVQLQGFSPLRIQLIR